MNLFLGKNLQEKLLQQPGEKEKRGRSWSDEPVQEIKRNQ